VPIKDGIVTSDARIRAALPTIRAALTAKAHVLVMSHLGRPEEGRFSEEFSLAPVAHRLMQLLGVPVALKRDWLEGVEVAAGEVVLLENVRFTRARKAIPMISPRRWRRCAISTSWMLSARRIAPRRVPTGSRNMRPSPARVRCW